MELSNTDNDVFLIREMSKMMRGDLLLEVFLVMASWSGSDSCQRGHKDKDEVKGCTFLASKTDCQNANLVSLPKGIPLDTHVLLLVYNNLTDLGDSMFSDFKELIELNVHGNKIRSVSSTAFDGLTYLEELDLSANQISQLPDDSLKDLKTLKILNLDGNMLQDLPATLQECQYLENLYIGGNKFNVTIFQWLNEIVWLEQLDLSYNEIDSLPYRMLDNLYELYVLRLHHNHIKHIDVNFGLGLTGMAFIDLADTGLSSITRSIFQPMPSLVFLNIAGNMFECNCDIKQVQHILHKKVSVLDEANCIDESGKEIAIESGKFDKYCTFYGGDPPAYACAQYYTIIFNLVSISDFTAYLNWTTTGYKTYMPDELPIANFRRYGLDDLGNSETVHGDSNGLLLQNMVPGTPYSVCIEESICHTRACIDIVVNQDGNGIIASQRQWILDEATSEITSASDLYVAVGATAGCFGLVIIILASVMAFMKFSRRDKNPKPSQNRALYESQQQNSKD